MVARKERERKECERGSLTERAGDEVEQGRTAERGDDIGGNETGAGERPTCSDKTDWGQKNQTPVLVLFPTNNNCSIGRFQAQQTLRSACLGGSLTLPNAICSRQVAHR